MTSLGIVLALAAIIACYILVSNEYKNTRDPLTPLVLFLGLSVLDIFLPSIFFLSQDEQPLPSWIRALNPESIVLAIISYVVYFCFFLLGYKFILQKDIFPTLSSRQTTPLRLNVPLAYTALLIAGLLYVQLLIVQTQQAGSVDKFIDSRLTMRWKSEAPIYTTFGEMIALYIGTTAFLVFFSIVTVFFYFRKQYNKPIFWGVLIPAIGWGFALTTFFRGTQLSYFLSLFAVDHLRRQHEPPKLGESPTDLTPHRRKSKLLLVVVACIAFVGYGTWRSFNISQLNTNVTWEEATRDELSQLLAGHGLIGLTSIIDFYPTYRDYFHGKTIYDVLLLPIPRLIYTSKPEWYGIDDITRGMGWPETTQSAVTVPGELYANFGFAGLVLGLLVGVIFGLFYKARHLGHFSFVYASTIFYTITTTSWMSFTGFANSVIRQPLIFLLMLFLIKPQFDRRTSIVR